MTPFDDEFLARYAAAGAEFPGDPEASVVIQYLVEGLPGGKRWFYETVVDGRVETCLAGRHAEPTSTVTWKADAAVALARGDVTDDVAYMRGDTKVEGEYQVWLDDLDAWRTQPTRLATLADLIADCD